jgi:hypothetical protein
MTRCTDFWKKWRKEPNFCGLSSTTVDEIEDYLKTVDKICTLGIKEDIVYENFPEGAARPLLRMNEGDPRTNVLNFVISSLKSGEKLTGKTVQATIKRFLPEEPISKDDAKVPQLRKPKAQLPVEKEPIKEPVVLHPELKPTSPYQPASGSIPVTDAPVQPSLAEQMKEEESEPGIIPAPKPAPCKDHHPREDFKISDQVLFKCPDGNAHLTVEKVRGRVCTVIGVPVIQLPGNECPIERNARMFPQGAATKPGMLDKGNTAFSRARELPKAETKWGMGKILTREEKMRVLCTQILIPKQVQVLKMLVKAGEADDELMALDVIIQEAAERMEV